MIPCQVSVLKLMRAISQVKKLKEKDRMGCNKRIEFMLKRYEHHQCRVYRRIRWVDEADFKKGKYKDWKVKVTQLTEPKSWDYLVVYKLPCSLKYVEEFIQKTMRVDFEKHVFPHPI